MGRLGTARVGLCCAVVALTLAVSPGAAPAGAGTEPTTTTTSQVGAGRVAHGLVFASPKSDDQRVSYYALEVRGGTTRIVATVRVRCAKGLVAAGDIAGTVDRAGRLRIDGPVSFQDGDDTFTNGSATFTGNVADDGTAAGTVSFHLTKTDQMNVDDVRSKCERHDVSWSVAAGTADPALARIRAVVPIDASLQKGLTLGGIAAGDKALFIAHDSGSLRRIDPATGKVVWRRVVVRPKHVFARIVVGAGAVWVADQDVRTPTIVKVDPETGKVLERVPGHSIAFAPDGSAWVTAKQFGHELRHVDPATGKVLASYTYAPRLTVGLAAGPAGVYVGTETANGSADDLIARIDPATGAIVASAPDVGGTGDLYADGTQVWYSDRTGEISLDPLTLAKRGADGVDAGEGVALGPAGLFVGDYTGLVALGPDGGRRFELPLTGNVATDGSTVLLLFLIEGQSGLAVLDGG
jgi:DNA-binding beta-propeller fold protein YncE